METIPNVKNLFSIPEVAVVLAWGYHDVRDAIIDGRITPSFYVTKPVWAYSINSAGQRSKETPATFKNQWMYVVGFKQTGSFDGHFEYLADTPDAMNSGGVIYQLVGNGFTKDYVVLLAEVLTHGAVMATEIDRFKAVTVPPPGTTSSSKQPGAKSRWWNQDYDVMEMAKKKMASQKASNYGSNQSGPRAGKHPIRTVAVATAISESEKKLGSTRTIGEKTIINYLKQNGWL